MSSQDVISLIVTLIGVASFATVFTILYHSYTTSTIKEITSGKRDIEIIDEVLYERQEKVKKSKKITDKIKSVVFCVTLALVIPLFVISLINKIQGNVTMIGNSSVMVVASNSMSSKHKVNDYLFDEVKQQQYNLNNQFSKYDIIVLNKVNSVNDLKVYDVIAFKNDQGVNIIHRIYSIQNQNGEITFTTRGDANNKSDTYQPKFEDIIGKYSNKKINTLGIFILFFQSYSGILTIVSLIYCLIMIDRYSNKINEEQEKRIEQLSEVIDYQDVSDIKSIKTEYVETIYYKGFAYLFNEQGFIEKSEIKDKNLLPKEDDILIQVVKDKNTNEQKTNEIIINTEKEDKEDE